jgi:hypothetical protein
MRIQEKHAVIATAATADQHAEGKLGTRERVLGAAGAQVSRWAILQA